MLENTAHACPVHRALAQTIDMPVTFRWTD
jgi:hypothetical protein